MEGYKKGVKSNGAKYPPRQKQLAVSAFPVDTVFINKSKTDKHGNKTAKKNHLHSRKITHLFNEYIHHRKWQGAEEHVANTTCER